MTSIAIIGCGIIGAAIAYELSQIEGLDLTLIDAQTPASGSTGAALGVLMGIISQKTKGRAWKMRQNSLNRYESLIPELEALTGQSISYNREGIVKLILAAENNLDKWQNLVKIRQSQGYNLEIWDKTQLKSTLPQINANSLIGAVYSPSDRQVNPTQLTQALVKGASLRGVKTKFGVKVQNFESSMIKGSDLRHCHHIYTTDGIFETDYLIVTAGIESFALTTSLHHPVDICPVLGQAIRIKLPKILGNLDFQPVITGSDVHIVPLTQGEYWIGATVEFPNDHGEVTANSDYLDTVIQQAFSLYPALKTGEIIEQWSGKRPRPQGRPAPIIETLTGYDNVILATGHYRNGVLLAPATAIAVASLQFKIKNS